jgi:hypothetical protein
MDANRFDIFTRGLTGAASSRRQLLMGVAGGALGGLLRLRGVKEVAAARTRTASCTADNGFITGDGDDRCAQSFTPAVGGRLSRVVVKVRKFKGTSGAYILQIVNIVGGKPDPDPVHALATARIRNRHVPAGLERTLAFNFAKNRAAPVLAGTESAFIVTRPGSTNLTVFQQSLNPCPGQAFFFDSTTGQFAAMGTSDFHFAAFVGYP